MLVVSSPIHYNTVMKRIETRQFAEALPDDQLLASQQALLNFDTSPVPFLDGNILPYHSLEQTAIHRLGETLAYDVTLAAEDSFRSKGEHTTYITLIGRMADRLLSYDRDTAVFGGYNRRYVRVEATSMTDLTPYGHPGTYTPEGPVTHIEGVLRQKAIEFKMNDINHFAEDQHFNFSSQGFLRLYTDNLAVQPPHWEYVDFDVSDILPGTPMRIVPETFKDDETALAVVTSLQRVIDASRQERIE